MPFFSQPLHRWKGGAHPWKRGTDGTLVWGFGPLGRVLSCTGLCALVNFFCVHLSTCTKTLNTLKIGPKRPFFSQRPTTQRNPTKFYSDVLLTMPDNLEVVRSETRAWLGSYLPTAQNADWVFCVFWNGPFWIAWVLRIATPPYLKANYSSSWRIRAMWARVDSLRGWGVIRDSKIRAPHVPIHPHTFANGPCE